MPSHGNEEREVLDPITHLPLIIHDVTDIELEQIPPPLSTAEERRRASAPRPNHPQHDTNVSNLTPDIAETNRHHKATDRLVEDLTQKGWWSDPGADLERFRVQAALVAGGTAGFGAMVGLFSWWLLSLLLSRQIFSSADLIVLPFGCCLLGLGVGVITVSFKLAQSPPTLAQLRSPSRLDSHSPIESDRRFKSIVSSPSRPLSRKNSQLKEASVISDSPEWLNSLFRSIWPIVNPALFTSIADTLEDSLQHSLPKLIRGVRMADIGQGVEPVRILGIQFLSPGSASQTVHGFQAEEGDYMNLEVAFAYRSKPTTSTMGLKGRSANLHMLMEFYTSGGIDMPVWVELTGFLGTARMRIQLTPNPPFVARMTLTLLGQPKVSMNCTPLAKNFLNVMDVPGLSSWLQHNVDSVIAEYVAPKSLNLDLQSMVLGVPKMDVNALGVIVVTIRRASGFKDADRMKVLKVGEDARERDVYVTVGWSKWGKFLWATRIISKDKSPVWEETTAILVNSQEVDAQEALRIQTWDADRITADDLIGTVDVPLSELMHSSKTLNRIAIREDQFHTDTPTAKPLPGKILWECGYFEKTTLEQHMEHLDEDHGLGEHDGNNRGTLHDMGNYEQVKAKIEAEAERKLREARTREILDQQIYREGEDDKGVGLRSLDQPAAGAAENVDPSENKRITSEVEQQKHEDLVSKSNELIATSSPSSYFPSGILSIRIEQISGLGVQKVRETGVKEVDDEDEDDLPSAYCEILINHQRVYKTRTKMKSSNPFFDAKTEKFIRSWESTNLIVAVRDNRLHEHSPILGVVVLPLASIFRGRSHFQNTLPIVGGVGYGRLKLELVFRSIQARLPKRLLGWDVGTLEISPRVFAVPSVALSGEAVNKLDLDDTGVADGESRKRKKGCRSNSISSNLAGCRLVFRSGSSKGKMFPFHPTHYHSFSREQSQPPRQLSEQQNHPPFSKTTQSRLSGSAPSIPSSAGSPTAPMIAPQGIVPPCPPGFERAENAAEAEWRPKHQSQAQADALKPLRLPILKRYACCIHILFRRSSHLGRDTTSAQSVLWLKDIPDEEEVVVQLPIRRERSSPVTGSAPASAQDLPSRTEQKRESQSNGLNSNSDGKDDEIIPGMMLVLRLRFWHGLSGYHQSLVSQSSNLEDVMEILDCAEDQEDISAGTMNGENLEIWSNESRGPTMPGEAEQEDDDDDSEDDGAELSEDSGEGVQPGLHSNSSDLGLPLQQDRAERSALKKHEFISDAQTQRKKPKESRRKHRGLMQWKYMREMAWVGHGIEHKAEKLGRKVKSGFKHQDRDAGIEKEV